MSLDVYLDMPKCPNCGRGGTLYNANITHNLAEMATAAGIYRWLWRPEELGVKTAQELIEPLARAIHDMKSEPDFYKKHDSPNGWGTYDDFVPWLEKYLQACELYPESLVSVSR
jgi:hypothetical protein